MRCVECGAAERAFESTRCGPCYRARRNTQARARYSCDLEKSRASAKARRAAKPEQVQRAYARWRASHLDQERARLRAEYWADPQHGRARVKAWADANPGYSAQRYANNPAGKKASQFKRKAAGTVSPADVAALHATDAHCAYCFNPGADTVDHVVPLSRGGTNEPGNLVLACFSCNSGKGARTPLEYLLDWRRSA